MGRELVWQIVWVLSAVFFSIKIQPKEKHKNVFDDECVRLYTEKEYETKGYLLRV